MSSTVDVRTGSQRPAVEHLPEPRGGEIGEQAVELARLAGLDLDPWQAWCLSESLAETDRHEWSAFEVAIIVGRQNGKGSILEARQLAGLFLLHERLQVHTAHEFKTGYEHFLRIVQLIESNPDFDARVQRVRRGAGEQAVELKTGERLRFLARSSGSGRGMSGDCVYLDEAFALTPQMMGALLPTLSARDNPQLWYTSSAPMSTSTVLHSVLDRGRSDDAGRLFYAEWSNPEGTDLNDRGAWYRSNPALGIRITEESVENELAALVSMPEEFERERLGVPSPMMANAKPVKVPADRWALTVGPPTRAGAGEVSIGYAIAKDGAHSSIAIGAGSLADPYVEVIDHRADSSWLPARLVELVAKWQPIAVGFNNNGPAGAQAAAVLEAFRAAGISADLLVPVNTQEYKQACGGFYTDVVEDQVDSSGAVIGGRPRLVRPDGQGPLDVAVAEASERPLGDAWAWDIRNATVPISPLEAVTVARALLPTERPATYDVLSSVL